MTVGKGGAAPLLVVVFLSASLTACDVIESATEVVILALSEILGGSFESPFDVRGKIEGDPLPDPWVDWHGYAEQAIEVRDCRLLAQITFRAEDWINSETEAYLDEIQRGEICSGEENEIYRRTAGSFHIFRTLSAGHMYQFLMSDYVGSPISSARALYQSEDTTWQEALPSSFFELEATWVMRCERPMYYAGSEFYHMRRGLAEFMEDASFLIPEWETRRIECAAIGQQVLETLREVQTHNIGKQNARLSDVEFTFRSEIDWLTGD